MDVEQKANAMLTELSQQRDVMGNRCVALSVEIARLSARVKELEEKLNGQTNPSPSSFES